VASEWCDYPFGCGLIWEVSIFCWPFGKRSLAVRDCKCFVVAKGHNSMQYYTIKKTLQRFDPLLQDILMIMEVDWAQRKLRTMSSSNLTAIVCPSQ